MIILFYLALHITGILILLPLKEKLPLWFSSSTGFVWGLLLWFFASWISLFLGLEYRWLNLLALILPVVGGALFLAIKNKKLPSTSKEWLIILGSSVGIALLAFMVTNKYYVYASTDSFVFIYHGRVLARSGLIPWSINLFNWQGAFTSVIQMSGQLLPGDYLSGYQTILGVSLLSVLLFSMVEQFKREFPIPFALMITIGLVLSLTSKIFQNHIFYIHSNLPAAILLFLSLYSFWQLIQNDGDEWIIPGVVALIGFSFTRIEGPLYSILILLLVISVKKLPYKKILILVLPYTLLNLFWHLYLYINFSQAGLKLLTADSLLIILGGLAALSMIAVFSKSLRPFFEILPELIIASLFFGLLLAIFIRPDHMIFSLTVFWQNLLNVLSWGWSWFVILAALPFLIMKTRPCPENRLLLFSFSGYILLVLLLVLARIPYRLGETDSSNRMMFQLLPVILFAISANAANIKVWFSPDPSANH